MNKKLYDSICYLLKKYINGSKKLLLAISGGPDSMFMFFILNKFFVENNFDLKNIFIAHYNHKFRKESDIENKYLKKIFKKYKFFCEEYSGKSFDENSLRKERYKFFERIIEQNNIDYLFLGHNLTDRIETTLLNMCRGCDIEGFLNMSFFTKNKNYSTIRPLINLSKDEIITICEKNNLKYFIDNTNFDNNISKRNFVRNEILSKLIKLSNKNKSGNNLFLSSFDNIYKRIEYFANISTLSLVEMNFKKYGIDDVEFCYRVKNLDSIDDIVFLFKKFNIYYNIQKSFLEEVFNFKNGYKYFNGYYLFKTHGKIFFVKGQKDFWKKQIKQDKLTEKIGQLINLEYNKKGSIIRYPIKGDKFGSKSLTKYFINKKIPFFVRNIVPLLEINKKITKIFDDILDDNFF